MIPLALVSGFLGSGKTTYLRHVVEQYRDRKLVYLVNEFSPLDVDGGLLQAREDDVYALPGGSIFCTCLVSEFIQALTSIPERFHEEGHPIEGVVIEASGVANPKVIERMLRETKLDALYELTAIVTVVDPASFPVLRQTLPNIIAQVEASDAVILNKTDLFPLEVVADVEAQVLRIQPGARIYRTVQAQVDIPLFDGRARTGMDGEYAGCADPNYARLVLRHAVPLDMDTLLAAIQRLAPVLYRVKGHVNTPEGMSFLDFSPAALTVHKSHLPTGPTELALIAKGTALPQARELHDQMRAGAFDA